jgi:hypothetical protein
MRSRCFTGICGTSTSSQPFRSGLLRSRWPRAGSTRTGKACRCRPRRVIKRARADHEVERALADHRAEVAAVQEREQRRGRLLQAVDDLRRETVLFLIAPPGASSRPAHPRGKSKRRQSCSPPCTSTPSTWSRTAGSACSALQTPRERLARRHRELERFRVRAAPLLFLLSAFARRAMSASAFSSAGGNRERSISYIRNERRTKLPADPPPRLPAVGPPATGARPERGDAPLRRLLCYSAPHGTAGYRDTRAHLAQPPAVSCAGDSLRRRASACCSAAGRASHPAQTCRCAGGLCVMSRFAMSIESFVPPTGSYAALRVPAFSDFLKLKRYLSTSVCRRARRYFASCHGVRIHAEQMPRCAFASSTHVIGSEEKPVAHLLRAYRDFNAHHRRMTASRSHGGCGVQSFFVSTCSRPGSTTSQNFSSFCGPY